ncbi:bifunctional oligoribonuclease/PAP phosphatase NrnA [Nonomuraea sp. NPDC046570]|uniref:DHH family phosphoesterase n=1 Tax=Nonomuraea sp. NPDC046570 TaxID=3155255 RepID=UPI0033C5CC28
MRDTFDGPAGPPSEAADSAHAGAAASPARERATPASRSEREAAPTANGFPADARTGGAGVLSEEVWGRAVELVRQADEIALACHVSPDGDALGSMLAMARILTGMGKRVVASFGDRQFGVPGLLHFLPFQELLSSPADFPAAPELMITFDSSTLERLGLLAASAGQAREVIVIDHHPSNTGFGTISLIDPGVAATAVLTEELIYRLGGSLSKDVATCLYVGLVTDTGSFRHSSTTPEAHEMAARLVATGLRPDVLARELWDRSPFGYLAVLSAALGRAVLEREGLGMVWTYITRGDRAAQGLPYSEVEGVIDVVRRTDEAEVTVVLKEDDEGAWQVSTRSKGAVDVAKICSALGGGGHAGAAGFTSHEPVDVTMARFRDVLRMS